MGTSKSFSDIRHAMIPNWGDLSSSVTRNCDSSPLSNDKKKEIMQNYVSVIGGAKKAGRGTSKISGQGGIRTAKKISSFLGSFIHSGNNLRDTLEKVGITNLGEKTVDDVINHLIEYCSSSATTIDDIAAKEATRQLLEELVSDATEIEEFGALLTSRFNEETLDDIIIRYFGYYIYEHLDKWFYEKLMKEKGESDCNNLFKEIKDFIFESLKDVQMDKGLKDIDWSTNEGDVIIKDIQEKILIVFE